MAGRRCVWRGAAAIVLALAPWTCMLVTGAAWAAELSGQERSALERIALTKARDELVEKVYALKLDDSLTVGDWAARDLGRDRALHLWLRNLPAHGAARAYSDGSCDVMVRLTAQTLSQKLQELAAGQRQPGASAPVPDFAQAARKWPMLWGEGSAWCGEAKLAGQPEGWEDVTAEGLEMARRAAEADARHALCELIGGLPVTHARRLSDFLESGDEVRDAVAAALRQSATVKVIFAPDQIAVARVRIGLVELIRILIGVYQKSYQGDLFHASDFGGMGLLATVNEVSATGLAVPPAAAMSRPRWPGDELDVPSWAAATMTATGRYVPADGDEKSQTEQAEAARLDGVNELRRGVTNLVIRDGMTVAAFFAAHEELQRDLDTFLSGARRAGSPTTQPGGAVAVPVELPLKRLWWIVRYGMQPAEMEYSDGSTSQPTEKDGP